VAKESRSEKRGKRAIRWGLLAAVAIWSGIAVSTAVAARKVHAFVIADARFLLPALNPDGEPPPSFVMQGVVRASRWRIVRAFTADFGRSIFSIPLAERRRRLLAIDWIEDASVSRLWPNRVIVRVIERKPVAFVNVPVRGAGGAVSLVSLIDSHGVILEPPPHSRFTFPVLSGVTDDQSEAERSNRVATMQRVLHDLGPLSKDVSEVNVGSLHDVTLAAQVENRAVELALGTENFASRYQNFLAYYPEIRKRSPAATAFDLRLDGRITVKESAQ
jgi:cell division protein FtsQ